MAKRRMGTKKQRQEMRQSSGTGPTARTILILFALVVVGIHRVYVDGFWMDTTAVTNAQFARFVDATGYVTIAERTPRAEDFPGATRGKGEASTGTNHVGFRLVRTP